MHKLDHNREFINQIYYIDNEFFFQKVYSCSTTPFTIRRTQRRRRRKKEDKEEEDEEEEDKEEDKEEDICLESTVIDFFYFSGYDLSRLENNDVGKIC